MMIFCELREVNSVNPDSRKHGDLWRPWRHKSDIMI